MLASLLGHCPLVRNHICSFKIISIFNTNLFSEWTFHEEGNTSSSFFSIDPTVNYSNSLSRSLHALRSFNEVSRPPSSSLLLSELFDPDFLGIAEFADREFFRLSSSVVYHDIAHLKRPLSRMKTKAATPFLLARPSFPFCKRAFHSIPDEIVSFKPPPAAIFAKEGRSGVQNPSA